MFGASGGSRHKIYLNTSAAIARRMKGSNMSQHVKFPCVIYQKGDISFRLYRNGRFSFRYEYRREPRPDWPGPTYGEENGWTWSEASGKNLSEVFGHFYRAPVERLQELRAILAMGEPFESEATRLQMEHAAKIRRGVAAAKAQREGDDLERTIAEIREANGGAL